MEEVKLIINAGSFGLLTFIVIAALKWLPKYAQEMQNEREVLRNAYAQRLDQQDAARTEDRETLLEALRSEREEWFRRLDAQEKEFRRERAQLMAAYREETKHEREMCARNFNLLVQEIRALKFSKEESR